MKDSVIVRLIAKLKALGVVKFQTDGDRGFAVEFECEHNGGGDGCVGFTVQQEEEADESDE